jgi:allophanate hydrolase
VVNAAGAGRNQAGEVGQSRRRRHLSGQPLNVQLVERDAKLVETTRTASGYRLYALADASPPKPGLVFNGTGPGAIEVEIWEMDQDAFGSFVAAIPPPLGIGTVTLADGRTVKGFLCEAYATDGAEDVTSFGGWRAWLSRSSGAAKRRASGNP